jgi:hypothetical protein
MRVTRNTRNMSYGQDDRYTESNGWSYNLTMTRILSVLLRSKRACFLGKLLFQWLATHIPTLWIFALMYLKLETTTNADFRTQRSDLTGTWKSNQIPQKIILKHSATAEILKEEGSFFNFETTTRERSSAKQSKSCPVPARNCGANPH